MTFPWSKLHFQLATPEPGEPTDSSLKEGAELTSSEGPKRTTGYHWFSPPGTDWNRNVKEYHMDIQQQQQQSNPIQSNPKIGFRC